MIVKELKIKKLPDKNLIFEKAKEYNINKVVAALMLQRGIISEFETEMFLFGGYEYLKDPFNMKDMDKAVSILSDAKKNNKRVWVFGDYDVDGISSLAIVYTSLVKLGFDVNWFLPNRTTDLYDLEPKHVDLIYEKGCDLLITADTGSNAVEAIEYAKKKGIVVIVTDHHEILTKANPDALINPKQEGCPYDFKYLSGTGVAYKFILAYVNKFALNAVGFTKSVIDFLSLATIADIMPLVDENRVMAKCGLEMMPKTSHQGFAILLREAYLFKDITAKQLQFKVIPKLNSASRMGDAESAYKLLIENDLCVAKKLYTKINSLNDERLKLEDEMVIQADEMIKERFENDSVLVLYSPKWPNSICGNVSAKLNKKYNRPAIILGALEGRSDLSKGSVRQNGNLNLLELVGKCGDLLYKFGGHKNAMGLTIEPKNIDLFREKINQVYTNPPVNEYFECDINLKFSVIDENFYKELNVLAPFGEGNEEPVFASKNIKVKNVFLMGKEKQHTKLTFEQGSGKYIEGVIWNYTNENLKSDSVVDVAYTLEMNDFNFTKTIQMIIKALVLH